MKRIFHHYEKWEDWKDGLYRRTLTPAEDTIVSRAARLLRTPVMLKYAMTHCAFQWGHAADVNLSNSSRNRQAWLGQAACCYVVGASESLTKAAWHRLSTAEQDEANKVADYVIALWEDSKCQSKV